MHLVQHFFERAGVPATSDKVMSDKSSPASEIPPDFNVWLWQTAQYRLMKACDWDARATEAEDWPSARVAGIAKPSSTTAIRSLVRFIGDLL